MPIFRYGHIPYHPSLFWLGCVSNSDVVVSAVMAMLLLNRLKRNQASFLAS
jgi:hypothetical protein